MDYLRSYSVFAVCCEIDDDSIKVGMLIFEDEDNIPEQVEFFDEDENSYVVEIPNPLPDEPFNLELRRL